MAQTLRLAVAAVLVTAAALTTAACSGDDGSGEDDAGSGDATADGRAPDADGSARDGSLADAADASSVDAHDGASDGHAQEDAHSGGHDAGRDATADAREDAPPTDAAAYAADASVAPIDAAADAHDAGADAATDSGAECGACPFACVSGVCTGTCAPGGTRCESGAPELCLANGTWKRSVGACTAACVAAPTRFVVDLASLTVKDTATGLVWQRAQASLAVDWEQAKADCAALPALGGKGRLPTLDELHGITLAACNPSTDEAAFPAAIAKPTWTSTASDPDAVQTVSFATGASETHAHIETLAVRCVRSP